MQHQPVIVGVGEVLGNLATLIRERHAFQGEVETLTAEARASAKVLSGLPVAIFFLLSWIDPNLMKPLMEQRIGHWVLIYAGVSTFLGYLVMLRLADVDI